MGQALVYVGLKHQLMRDDYPVDSYAALSNQSLFHVQTLSRVLQVRRLIPPPIC